MTSPTRRPTRLRDVGIDRVAEYLERHADEITLGWSILLAELKMAGWPARSPEGDRRLVPVDPVPSDRSREVWECTGCGHHFDTWAEAEEHDVNSVEEGHDEFVPIRTGHDVSGIDYTDPTGELAGRLDRLHRDRESMEDHRHLITKSLDALIDISRRHRTEGSPSVPACTYGSCTEPVEYRTRKDGTKGYVGCVQIAGIWCTTGRPTCAKHRRERRVA